MQIKINSKSKFEVKYDNVCFYITVKAIKDDAKKAIREVYDDVKIFLDNVNKDEFEVTSSPVNIRPNMVYVTEGLTSKTSKHVQKGYIATCDIALETKIDSGADFAGIYKIGTKLKNSVSINYSFVISKEAIDRANSELRKILIQENKKQAKEIHGEENGTLELIDISYGVPIDSPRNDFRIAKNMCYEESFGCANAEPEDESYFQEIVDLLIRPENAPTYTAEDSVYCVYSFSKSK